MKSFTTLSATAIGAATVLLVFVGCDSGDAEPAPMDGADLSARPEAPSEFVDRPRLRECGVLSVKLEALPRLRFADSALDCFLRATRGDDGAEIVAEGRIGTEPVLRYIRALPGGGVEIFYETTAPDGPLGWHRQSCESISVDLVPKGCVASRSIGSVTHDGISDE